MKRKYWRLIASVGLFIIIVILFQFTGIFQKNSIDDRDKAYWNYSDGKIIDSNPFTLQGNDDCWLLIHSYVSTPDEMRPLATAINTELNHTVKAILLRGHGTYPSDIVNLTLDDWYDQAEQELIQLQKDCTNVNVVGSSLGGTITTKLAEEHDFNKVVLVNPYLKLSHKPQYVFELESYIRWFSDILLYDKKTKLIQVNDPVGLQNHIAYWNMPFQPIKNSLDEIENIRNNFDKINEPILILHSHNDVTADYKSVELLYDCVESESKQLKWYDDSVHILLADYNRTQVINDIIEFGKK